MHNADLAETKASEGTEASAQSWSTTLDDAWHTAIVSVIYLIYLGCESARNAINDLVATILRLKIFDGAACSFAKQTRGAASRIAS